MISACFCTHVRHPSQGKKKKKNQVFIIVLHHALLGTEEDKIEFSDMVSGFCLDPTSPER